MASSKDNHADQLPLKLTVPTSEDHIGWDGEKWLMFGSFAEGADGPGTVSDFSVTDAVPCFCASPSHGGPSLLECRRWCIEFLSQLGNMGVRPCVKVVHWKGKHVIFIGPFPNPESVIVAVDTIHFLRVESKAQFLIMPNKPDNVEED